MKQIRSSIIIRTFNEGKHLARLLDSILTQDYKDWEIILVDSESTDDTLDIAAGYPVKIVKIRKEDFSFGYSLNAGCRSAAGEYLVFVSGHTYPMNNEWLGNMVAPFEDQRVGMVYGRQIGNDTTKISEEKDMMNNFGEKSKILVEESFGNNANTAIRKSLWLEIPYDEKLPGLEDIDWSHKIQKRGLYIYYRADAVVCHIHDETYAQIYNRFKRESIAHKIIFPEHLFNARKVSLMYSYMILRDIYFGFSLKKPLRNILTAIPYRIAEYRGWRDGFSHTGKINDALRQELSFPQKNRSVIISGRNQHRLDESEIPSIEDDEVLISVQYVGVCSTDIDVLKGSLDYYKSGLASYPIVPGHEFSGIIAKTGKNVLSFRTGDKVVGECILGCGTCGYCKQNMPVRCEKRKEVGVMNCHGAYSRYLKMAARFVHKLPADAPLEKACLIEPLAVSIRGVNKLLAGEDRLPRNVAVLGYGTIGNLCAQLLASKGHGVTVFDKNPARIKNIKNSSIKGETKIAGLERFGYIIEATGQEEVLVRVLNDSATGTKILLLGLPYSAMNFNFENIVSYDKTVIGSVGSTRDEFAEAVRIYTKLDMDNLTENIFPLEEYETAWHKQRDGQVAKAILSMNGGV